MKELLYKVASLAFLFIIGNFAAKAQNGLTLYQDANKTMVNYYADNDGDGYGAGAVVSTSPGSGLVSNNMDCNDNASSIHPGAIEIVGDNIDQDCNGQEVCYTDADNDGYRPNSTSTINSADMDCADAMEAIASDPIGDCNDNNGNIYPTRSEIVADGVDQDCDGMERCYVDSDNDNYGSFATTDIPTMNCVLYSNAAPVNTDCNDNNATIYPGATEIVGDGIDQDCNGMELCYVDNDNDNYGTNSTFNIPTMSCLIYANAAPVNTDCNDGNASWNPGATDVCNGIDDDCDGYVDEGVLLSYYIDNDGDGYGDGAMFQTCSIPSNGVAITGDCNDNDDQINPSVVEICGNGKDDNCDGQIDDCSLLTVTKTGNGFGTVVSLPSGINFGIDSTEIYLNNTSVTLTVTPDPGTSFIGWGGDAASCGANISCPITLNTSQNVSANFQCTNDPAPIMQIYGSDSICAGSTQTYSVDADVYTMQFVWTLPIGWTGSSSTNSITVTAGNTGGNITVLASNSCGSNSPFSMPVIVSDPATTSILYAGSSACSNSANATAIIVGPNNGTFSSASGLSINSATGEINVEGSLTGIYNITYSVSGQGGCSAYTTDTNFAIYPVLNDTAHVSICSGDFYNWQGNNYSTAGTYSAQFNDINGCDSNYVLVLSINTVNTGIVMLSDTLATDTIADSYQWLDCNNNYSVISGETNRTFVPSVTGNYSVALTNGSCTDTSACINVIITGNKNHNSDLKIFPNPVKDKLIVSNGSNSAVQLELINMVGERVYKGQFILGTAISVSELPSGIYYLKIIAENEVITKRIIKE